MKARKIIMKNEDGTVLYIRFELPKDANLQPFAELENLLKSKELLKKPPLVLLDIFKRCRALPRLIGIFQDGQQDGRKFAPC